ncbi:L,D-transpeptidase [Aquisalimonas lutea]|uniref:L,D-transpeptidase family protein n=1 Tax=Aquisalimonas lutea TaxID=1327750 RepID=UPI0025B512AD|nr:L,D-transpeptidase [Aquisalimonas lutea]MDN3518438.1 L,D-transpeptidase [Aquisalimonas lutea]
MARLLTLLLLLVLPAALPAAESWVLVDTHRQEMRVYADGEQVLHFPRIAIGRGGASRHRRQGDQTTPIGEFRIAWVNPDSRFHKFFGLDFPNFRHVRHAYNNGTMSLDEFLSVTDALKARRLPPQDTSVGGHIGIHGLGEGDPDLHRRANWTEGCIAITDEQMDQLAEYVEVGTRVVVAGEGERTAQASSR